MDMIDLRRFGISTGLFAGINNFLNFEQQPMGQQKQMQRLTSTNYEEPMGLSGVIPLNLVFVEVVLPRLRVQHCNGRQYNQEKWRSRFEAIIYKHKYN